MWLTLDPEVGFVAAAHRHGSVPLQGAAVACVPAL